MEYTKQYANYYKKLTPKQKETITAERKEQKLNQVLAIEKKNRKNELLDAGKPKRPLSAYFLFAATKAKGTQMNASHFKSEWEKLNSDQKSAYKQQSQKLQDAYQ